MDHLPSGEREKIRKRMRSPEAYEALREKVKGPEDLQDEMDKNERLAELSFALESEPKMQEKLKSQIENDIREQGIENMSDSEVSPDAKKAMEQGKFTVNIEPHPKTHIDTLTVNVSEGNVQEKIPLKQSLSDHYAGGLMKGK